MPEHGTPDFKRRSYPGAYLDNAATTRLDPMIAARIDHVARNQFGNPSSAHGLGIEAEGLVRESRRHVARALGFDSQGVFFFSSATEALATAILSAARSERRGGHLLISQVEHAAVRNTALMLGDQGHKIEEIPVDEHGRVLSEALSALMREDTFLVAVMHVNNEIGTVQPIRSVVEEVKRRSKRCRVICDMVQSFPALDLDAGMLGVDAVAITGHKNHGPKGIAALGCAPGFKLHPLWRGGDQENGRRPGTENVPAIVGLGLAAQARRCDWRSLMDWGKTLFSAIVSSVPDARLLVNDEMRSPHIMAVALPGFRSEVVVNALSDRDVYISSGSACHGRGQAQSHVLEALRVPRDHGVIRISLSRLTDNEEIEFAADVLAEDLKRWRR